ncbi:hypothetical protein JB92DRAFT_2838900 [Gautieria morchelliformis]|nr:hypothetical protein JB92DRAFT_2838900 [Gautieria morchelliformis]
MSQHNQGVRWVLGGLGLLLYMAVWFLAVKNGCNITAQDLGALNLVNTINTVLIILFETLVVVVTLYNTLGLVSQDMVSITLAAGITSKALRVSPLLPYTWFDFTCGQSPALEVFLELCMTGSLSVIIICRCHLALQERAAHPNGTTCSAHNPATSFRAAARQIHDSLMEEFGDPSIEEIGTSEAIGPHREDNPCLMQ